METGRLVGASYGTNKFCLGQQGYTRGKTEMRELRAEHRGLFDLLDMGTTREENNLHTALSFPAWLI